MLTLALLADAGLFVRQSAAPTTARRQPATPTPVASVPASATPELSAERLIPDPLSRQMLPPPVAPVWPADSRYVAFTTYFGGYGHCE